MNDERLRASKAEAPRVEQLMGRGQVEDVFLYSFHSRELPDEVRAELDLRTLRARLRHFQREATITGEWSNHPNNEVPMPVSSHKPVSIQPWIFETAKDLVRAADRRFLPQASQGGAHHQPFIPAMPKRGPDRKRWVKDALKDLLRKHDVKAIPNWVEGPLEDLVVDLIVEVAFVATSGDRISGRWDPRSAYAAGLR